MTEGNKRSLPLVLSPCPKNWVTSRCAEGFCKINKPQVDQCFPFMGSSDWSREATDGSQKMKKVNINIICMRVLFSSNLISLKMLSTVTCHLHCYHDWNYKAPYSLGSCIILIKKVQVSHITVSIFLHLLCGSVAFDSTTFSLDSEDSRLVRKRSSGENDRGQIQRLRCVPQGSVLGPQGVGLSSLLCKNLKR